MNSDGDEVRFAPLESKRLDVSRWPIGPLIDRSLVKRLDEKPPLQDVIQQVAVGTMFVGFIAAAMTSAVAQEHPDQAVLIWFAAVTVFVLGVAAAILVMFSKQAEAGRLVAQGLTLTLVVAISVGLPLALVWRFAPEDLATMSGTPVFVRLMQITLISIAAMLPGLLFFFFDRQKLSTLRDRFESQIFRLDPNVHTLADVYARYGSQIEEAYGTANLQGVRLARQRRWPILLGTLVLTIGWTVTVMPIAILPSPLDRDGIARVLTPQPDPVVFGFLGSYFFALNLVWRRYTRGDLRPKAYTAITVRVLIVLVLTSVWAAVTPQGSEFVLVASFLTGLVPATFFVLVRESVARGKTWESVFGALQETQPLQDLKGIDLYDRARLMDEGVSNIQALAHHDVVDLLFETRIPAGRLMDWVDQAILYMHTRADGMPADGSGNGKSDLWTRLTDKGIRTATDFERNLEKVQAKGLVGLLDLPAAAGECQLGVVACGLEGAEWMPYVRRWRSPPPPAIQEFKLPPPVVALSDPSTRRRVETRTPPHQTVDDPDKLESND